LAVVDVLEALKANQSLAHDADFYTVHVSRFDNSVLDTAFLMFHYLQQLSLHLRFLVVCRFFSSFFYLVVFPFFSFSTIQVNIST